MSAESNARTEQVAATSGAPPLLSVRNLRTHFWTEKGVVKAVEEVSFDVPTGRTLAVVGESGCGKSVTALSIMRLIPDPPGKIVGGEVLLGRQDLLAISEKEMRGVRGKKISMIFQEPMTSLNPVLRVGEQIKEALRLHEGMDETRAHARAVEMLDLVGIPDASERISAYPHQLSGGMRQRVMIAMALSTNPMMLIADEPSTALDVTIQAQIMDLLAGLQRELGMSIMLITHDLGVVAETAHELVVMYAARIVERGTVDQIFLAPAHPYTQGLLRSVPSFEETAPAAATTTQGRKPRLKTIDGMVPDLLHLPPGCRFQDRCAYARPSCAGDEPPLRPLEDGREVRCPFPLPPPDGYVSREAGAPSPAPDEPGDGR